MGWPQGQAPLGEAVGEVSALQGASVSTVCPSPQPFSNWLEFPGELKGKRKLDGHSRVPGREGGNDISQTSALSQALCQVLHSSNLPDPPPFVVCFAPKSTS